MNKPIKVALGYPWYAGADRDCVTTFLANQHYLGRLQERLSWINQALESAGGGSLEEKFAREMGCTPEEYLGDLPPLDKGGSGGAEVTPELIGTEFEFFIADEVACSLPGLARERIVDKCLEAGMDYILWSDADMIWKPELFLRLYLDHKPIVGALAFTGRKPIMPVIYNLEAFGADRDEHDRLHVTFNAQPRLDYKRNELQQVDAIGSGVMLINCEAFKKIERPWFASYGVGEDIFFCARAKACDVPVYVDTRAKTYHRPTFHDVWHGEEAFDAQKLFRPEAEDVAVPV